MKKLIFLAWLSVALSVFFASFKSQVIFSADSKYQKIVSLIMPQGWGFFTKDPRDNQLDVYKMEDEKIKRVTINNFSAETYFGVSRKARFIGYESAQVINNIDEKYWRSDIFGNLSVLKNDAIFKYDSDSLKYLTKGTYIFITYKIVPYKWAKSNQEKNNPIEFAFVEIE